MRRRSPWRRRLYGIPPAWEFAFACALLAFHGVSASERLTQPPDCLSCHTCSVPTHGEPCPRPCTRNLEEQVAKVFANKQVPDLVVLDQLASLYLPVPFDHKGHAAMAEMTGNCAVCHHYTPQGAAYPACRTCHSAEAGADIRKPGLRGAYHRQCLSCHREWGGEASCSVCHQPRAGRPSRTPVPTTDDLVGRMHPPISEPDLEMYRTEREGYSASKVLFRHKEHSSSYDLKCSDCHREDNCSRCHAANKTHVQHVRSIEEHHQPCMRCHANNTCDRCHFSEGQAPPKSFAHDETGWPLKRYHQAVNCRKCHVAPPYKPLETQCGECHSSWSPKSFNHTVTGLELDSTHRGFDCEQCHAAKNFNTAPVCTECHEEKEKISFPAKRPGTPVPSRNSGRL